MKTSHNRSILLKILFSALFSISTARDTITPTQPLTDNETLVSSRGQFALGFFTPANSSNRYLGLWYKISTQTILWVANRDKPVTNSKGLLSITSSGVLTITDKMARIVWSANTSGLTNPVAQLLDNGNFVVKEDEDNTGNYAWQGFNYPTDTVLPGMKVGLDRTTGLNSTMTSWKSDNDPSPGLYSSVIDPRGIPELFTFSGTRKIWRSGVWNGLQLSGTPYMSNSKGIIFNFVNNTQELAYSYEMFNQTIVSRLVLNQAGVIQRVIWLSESNKWDIFWYVPRDPCDNYGVCGPYGSCNPNSSPLCKCLLPTFMPKNPANWALRNNVDGCTRRTPLNCSSGTDGFVVVRNVKLPESANSTMDMSLNLDECKEMCLKNCSCTACATANISGDGSGCIIWLSELVDIRLFVNAGQDLYVRLAGADIVSPLPVPEQAHKRKSSTVAILLSLLSGILLLAYVGFFIWRRNKRLRGAITSLNDHAGTRENDLDLPLFEFGSIAASTLQFSEENKLGEGGFGPVYKGKLEDAQEIAVKRLARTSVQGIEEFKNEMVLISKLQHRNLVRLLGCCIQGEERMLVYEYMPNKSLDTFLFEKEKGTLDWQTCYQIILGITRGLLYLHQDSRFRIIHRDLKASNILLDKDLNPKISDFGMARIFGGEETDFNTRKIVGTYGYMSPEYAMDGIFSVKSDVFSFGVLVLEIVSGKKNRGVYSNSYHINFLSYVSMESMERRESMQLVDESMLYSFPKDEVLKCIKLGLLCVQECPEDRPTMSSVILMFGRDVSSLPQPKQPGFASIRGPFKTEALTSEQDLGATNDITLTMIEGR